MLNLTEITQIEINQSHFFFNLSAAAFIALSYSYCFFLKAMSFSSICVASFFGALFYGAFPYAFPASGIQMK